MGENWRKNVSKFFSGPPRIDRLPVIGCGYPHHNVAGGRLGKQQYYVNRQKTSSRAGKSHWPFIMPGAAKAHRDLEWGQAFMSKGPASQKLGFIYMLVGDNGASNADPYAMKETPDNNWVKTGDQVMIVGAVRPRRCCKAIRAIRRPIRRSPT
jgi:hypothetical protein